MHSVCHLIKNYYISETLQTVDDIWQDVKDTRDKEFVRLDKVKCYVLQRMFLNHQLNLQECVTFWRQMWNWGFVAVIISWWKLTVSLRRWFFLPENTLKPKHQYSKNLYTSSECLWIIRRCKSLTYRPWGRRFLYVTSYMQCWLVLISHDHFLLHLQYLFLLTIHCC